MDAIEKSKLEEANKRYANARLIKQKDQFQAKAEQYKKVLEDFLAYFDPKGGISSVPLGPFERANEVLEKIPPNGESLLKKCKRKAKKQIGKTANIKK